MVQLARALLLISLVVVFGAILFILSSHNTRPTYIGHTWDSEQLSRLSVDTKVPSVSTETPSPQSVSVHSVVVDVKKSDEPSVQSQPGSISDTNGASTEKPVTPLSINLVIVLYRSTSNGTKLKLREQEHAIVLRRNLNHSLVNSVHIITDDKGAMEEYLRGLDLPNRHKIVVVESEQWNMMRGIFEYISNNLLDKDAMYANGDIYLGSGFEKVDADVLSSRKIFYALSRHGQQEETCKMNDYCGGDHQYLGSHDVFLFHLKEPIPEKH